jgi:hypothetical protein
MDVTRQERDAIDEGDQNTEDPGDDLLGELPARCHMPNSPPLPSTRLTKWRQGKRLGVCRMHGARGGAPVGERNGNYRHGAGTFPKPRRPADTIGCI